MLAATREPPPDPGELARLQGPDIDWTMVRVLASQERLLTVFWPRLERSGIAVPPEHVGALRMQTMVAEFQLGTAGRVLQDVADVSHSLGIDLMLLKGAALALTVYSGFHDRPMGDLDVVARGADADRLWTALREAGWELEAEGGAAFYEGHQHLPPLVWGGGLGVVLEIHRSLLAERSPFLLDDEHWWQNTRTVDFGGHDVAVLRAEAQLLHLAIHFAWSHALGRGLGRTVRDVSAVIAATPPDWEVLVRDAHAARAGSSLYWTLRLARSLGGASVPDEVLTRLRPARPRWLLSWLERSFVEAALFRSCPYPRILEVLWALGIDPKGSGHGRERPWGADDQFRAEVAHLADDEASGLADRVARIPAGLGYLKRMVSGALGGGTFHSDLS